MADYDATSVSVTVRTGVMAKRHWTGTAPTFGGAAVTHTYLMGGWVGGAPVQWVVNSTPDWTGASYPLAPPFPTAIKIVSQLV